MLTRTQFLKVSDFTDARFQSLTRRHLDRLHEEWDESPSQDVERWRASRRKYVWRDVLIMRTMDALTFDGGLSQERSFSAAGNLVTIAEPSKLADRAIELWGAVAFFKPYGRSHQVGTMDTIAAAMAPPPDGFGGFPVARIVLVNLSNAARETEEAAAAEGFLVDWNK